MTKDGRLEEIPEVEPPTLQARPRRELISPSRRKVTADGRAVPWSYRPPPSPEQLAARAHRNTAAWQRVRAEQLRRAPYCEACVATNDLTVDHRIPLADGGTDAPENLRTLCRRCNGRLSALRSLALRRERDG